jgi:hypothetical protein
VDVRCIARKISRKKFKIFLSRFAKYCYDTQEIEETCSNGCFCASRRSRSDNESTENNGHEGNFSDINIDRLLLFLILHAGWIFSQHHVIDFRSSIDPGWIIQSAVTGSDCFLAVSFIEYFFLNYSIKRRD